MTTTTTSHNSISINFVLYDSVIFFQKKKNEEKQTTQELYTVLMILTVSQP